MKIEWYSVLVFAVYMYLWARGSVLGSVIAMMVFTMFGGGAAFIVGHANIVPASLALILLVAHTLLTMFTRSDHVMRGLKTNGPFAFFCIYSAITAFLLPRIFARVISISPLTGVGGPDLYLQAPIHFSIQNITTAFYLIAALLTSVAAGAAAMDPRSRRAVVLWAVAISWGHIFFGVAGAFLDKFGGNDLIKIFRNATYAELVQSEGGFVRIAGIFPEPSAYANFAFGWFVFMVELWLRDVYSRLTFVTATALGLILLLCTSSAGYIALATYTLIVLSRFALAPRSLRPNKVIPIVMLLLIGLTLVIGIAAFDPSLAAGLGRLSKSFTIGKLKSASAEQRFFWVRATFNAIRATGGLGVGSGSFRSSSLILAILGSSGVIGLTAFLAHLIKILNPVKTDTYELPGHPWDAVPVAAAWCACAGLLPAIAASPTPDPGYNFAIMGGLALGWRYRPKKDRSASMAGRRTAAVATNLSAAA